MTKINNEYFEWLCDLVSDFNQSQSYYILLKELHKREFYSVLPNDENRADDGLNMRWIFLSEYHPGSIKYDLDDTPCTVFEMLVGLSRRMELSIGRSMKEWFWEFIENLGMSELSDERYPEWRNDGPFPGEILKNFLDRRYDEDGKGGLFPMKFSTRDQREIEIWFQMFEYVDENYPI